MSLKVFAVVLQHLGNDPRIFALYFTCKFLYGFYGKRYSDSQKLVHNNGGILWNMNLEDGLNWCAIKKFFARIFNGYIIIMVIFKLRNWDRENGLGFL